MARIEVRLPEMGESVAEATITRWVKAVGDQVEADEVIVEVATDKVDSEIVTETAGTLIEQRFALDEIAQVGQVLAIIETDSSSPTSELDAPAASVDSFAPYKNLTNQHSLDEPSLDESTSYTDTRLDNKEVSQSLDQLSSQWKVLNGGLGSESNRLLSPLVRSMALEEGIPLDALDTIKGTGLDGRITKYDMAEFIEHYKSNKPSVAKVTQGVSVDSIAPSLPKLKEDKLPPVQTGDEVLELSRMTRLTAEHMSESLKTAAHVQSFIEVDVTSVVAWRDQVKDAFQKKYNEKLTFTPIFFEVVADALRAYPMMNIQFDGKQIVKKSSINIGMAAALADGNLIVPVVKDADTLNLVGLAKKVNDLANRARAGELKPDEVTQGTYTITNIGSFGSVMGTPIIPQPQVGILAIGAIRKVPAVVETEAGEFIAIRHKMFLSHSYDHRVVNGALGGWFIKYIADKLEGWDSERNI